MRFDRLGDWLAWLETLHPSEIELGLDRLRRVAAAAGLLDPKFPIITVAGTNGKGSVCALLEAALAEAGYRTGCYTSPHIERFNERVRLERKDVGDDEMVAALDWVDRHRGDISLTYFEFTTLAAMRLFQQADIDVAVLEVGLGGRLDAVNLWDSDVALITSVDVDHVDWLGDNREAIGAEKAGVCRSGRPLICGDPLPPDSVRVVAERVGAELSVASADFSARLHDDGCWDFIGTCWHLAGLPAPGLPGDWQYGNAATALEALSRVEGRLLVSEAALRVALLELSLLGRFERHEHEGVEVIFDVAHNPHAVAALAQALADRRRGRTLAVAGFMADKAVGEVLGLLQSEIDGWYLGELPGARAMTVPALAQLIGSHSARPLSKHENAAVALSAALAAAEEGDRVLVFGSFVTVAEARRGLL